MKLWKQVSFCGLTALFGGACDSVKPSDKVDNAAAVAGSDGTTEEGEVALSLEAQAKIYEETVYPIVAPAGGRCAACHASATAPFFAAATALEAFNAINDTKKMDLLHPEQSRIVLRLRSESHNCWSNCSDDATEVENAIKVFVQKLAEQGGGAQAVVDESIRTVDVPLSYSPNVYSDLKLELEDQSLFSNNNNPSPFDVSTDDNLASGAAYLSRPRNNNDGGVRVKFLIPKPGFYRFFFRVMVADNERDYDFDVYGSGLPFAGYAGRFETTAGEWKWQAARLEDEDTDLESFYFQAQEYTIEIKPQNAIRFDQIAISDNPAFEGSTFSPQMASQTLTYKLSGQIKAKHPEFIGDAYLNLDVEFTPQGSYIFRNPRMISTDMSLQVQQMKFFYSNKYSEQYKTYESIDVTLDAGEYVVLWPAAMVVLQDTNPQDDSFGFSFKSILPIAE
jgi:hypothetical protein